MSFFFFAASALAADGLCPRPDDVPRIQATALAESGDALVLAAGPERTCLWRVDDNGDGRVLTRWTEAAPVGVAAIHGATVLYFADGRVQVRHDDGARATVHVAVEGDFAGLLGHPELPRVALLSGTRVIVVDLETGNTVSSQSLTVGNAVSFVPGRAELQIVGPLSDSRLSRR